MSQSSAIQKLLDQVEELYVHARNQGNLKKWVEQPARALDNKWRHIAVPLAESGGEIPIAVNMEPSLRSSIFGYSVREYFQNPENYLTNYLKHEIFHYTEIQDDVPLLLQIPIYHTAYLEGALCGVDIVYLDDHDAVLPETPLLMDLADVNKLPLPRVDKSSKAMSDALCLYEFVCEQVEGREFAVTFVDWLRNPFGLATWLYGEERLVEAIPVDPEGVHRLLEYAVHARQSWTEERSKFLQQSTHSTPCLYSDSVGSSSLTPEEYLEFVQPYELKVAEEHGGIYYWHCCGDSTRHLKHLANLPLELFHVGPWTSACAAAEAFSSKGTALEICLQKHGHYGPGNWSSEDDIFAASEAGMATRISRAVSDAQEGGATAFCIEAGPLHRTHNPAKDLEAVQKWVAVARKVLVDTGR